MNKVKKGIFRISFPFAEGGGFKCRPALALTDPDGFGDVVWAFISTKARHSAYARQISPDALISGALPHDCYLHLEKTFTIHTDRIVSRYGTVSDKFWGDVQRSLVLRGTREFSQATHAQNRPGNDPLHPHNVKGSGSGEHGAEISCEKHPVTNNSGIAVPYAGRVFNEDEVEAAVSSTLDFWLTLGEHGEAMQEELAGILGVKKSLLVNSGSSANLIAVAALTTHKLPEHKRIKPGDEVITCAAGFPTTVAPILQNGAVPVFIDNDPTTGNARMDQLEAAYVVGKTKAVMFAHTLGNPFDLAEVCEFCHKHELYLIEDNCDALGCSYTLPVERADKIGLDHLLKIARKGGHGWIRFENLDGIDCLTAPTGAFGDLSTQSFYPPHHLTMGEGGAVNVIRRASLAKYAESFRDWGRDCWCPSGKDNTCNKRFGWQLGELPEGYDHKYIYSHIGYNLKPLDPQAAIGRKQIEKLPAFIQARKDNWNYLREGLKDLEDYFDFTLSTGARSWESGKGFTWAQPGYRTDCSWFGFMLLVKPDAPFTKSAFASYLDENRIGNRMLFGGNLLRQPAFVQLKKDRPEAFRVVGEMVGADRIMNEAVFIGVYPGLSKAQLDHMVTRIRDFVTNAA